jgi:hypothetical protein
MTALVGNLRMDDEIALPEDVVSGPEGPPGTPGMDGRTSHNIPLLAPNDGASAAATNLAVNVFNAVGDPAYRRMVDLRSCTKVRILGRFGGTVSAVTRLRVQYHVGGNPAVVTGDAGWQILADSAPPHVVATMFYSAEAAIPAGAQINHCLVRAGIFSGDGVADPTITACVLNSYAP